MRLELVATPAELAGESVDTLRAKIVSAAGDVARGALEDGLKKARSPECCGDVLHKARGARGGEVDLVAELAGRMEHLYRMRLSALESDLDNMGTKD